VTTTQEPGSGGDVLPRFAEIAQQYVDEFSFDHGSYGIIQALLVRGTGEILRIPEGQARDEATESAAQRLDRALQAAAAEFRDAGLAAVGVESLTSVMEGLCPVPPFCMGAGPGEEPIAVYTSDPAEAEAKEEVYA
jgi:hypothetical protein